MQAQFLALWALYNSQLQYKNNDKSSNFCESGSLFEPSKLIKEKTHFWHPTAKNFTTVQFHCVNKIVLESNIFFLWILSDVLCVFDSTKVHFHYQFMRYIHRSSESQYWFAAPFFCVIYEYVCTICTHGRHMILSFYRVISLFFAFFLCNLVVS